MKNYQLFKERKRIMENKTHLFNRFLPLLLAIITTIVVIFMAQILLDVKAELKEVKTAMRNLEQEKISNVSFKPFTALEENCTSCHNERKFMGIHGGEAEITSVIKFMEQMPDVHLSSQDVDKIHGSLSLLRCVKCHDEEQLKILGTLSSAKQKEVIEKMSKKRGAGILPEDIDQIQLTLLKVQGF
jgi:hypothetical protein